MSFLDSTRYKEPSAPDDIFTSRQASLNTNHFLSQRPCFVKNHDRPQDGCKFLSMPRMLGFYFQPIRPENRGLLVLPHPFSQRETLRTRARIATKLKFSNILAKISRGEIQMYPPNHRVKSTCFHSYCRAESEEYQDIKKYRKRGRDVQRKKRILTSLAETERSVIY